MANNYNYDMIPPPPTTWDDPFGRKQNKVGPGMVPLPRFGPVPAGSAIPMPPAWSGEAQPSPVLMTPPATTGGETMEQRRDTQGNAEVRRATLPEIRRHNASPGRGRLLDGRLEGNYERNNAYDVGQDKAQFPYQHQAETARDRLAALGAQTDLENANIARYKDIAARTAANNAESRAHEASGEAYGVGGKAAFDKQIADTKAAVAKQHITVPPPPVAGSAPSDLAFAHDRAQKYGRQLLAESQGIPAGLTPENRQPYEKIAGNYQGELDRIGQKFNDPNYHAPQSPEAQAANSQRLATDTAEYKRLWNQRQDTRAMPTEDEKKRRLAALATLPPVASLP